MFPTVEDGYKTDELTSRWVNSAPRQYSRPRLRPSRPAMTLVEMTTTVVIVGIAFFLVAGWMSSVRAGAKEDLAIRLLADLDRALSRYHRVTGFYPPSSEDGQANVVIGALLLNERTKPLLETLPSSVWLGPGKRNLVDPWGMPLKYFPATSKSPLVKANDGRPLFVSAGPDRIFGDDDPAGLGDDLRSDDPGPEGFRLEHALREAAIEKEQSDGEENH